MSSNLIWCARFSPSELYTKLTTPIGTGFLYFQAFLIRRRRYVGASCACSIPCRYESFSQSQAFQHLHVCVHVSLRLSYLATSRRCRVNNEPEIEVWYTLLAVCVCVYIIKINKIFDVFIQELKHVSLVGFPSHLNHQKRLDENEKWDDVVTTPTTPTTKCAFSIRKQSSSALPPAGPQFPPWWHNSI